MSEQPVTIPLARPLIGDEEVAAVEAVMRSGMLAQGAQVAAFEAAFADVVDGRTCVAVSSGTAALHLGLLAAGIGPGDEVVVPSFTFAATANAVCLTGATPVFADISPGSFTLDPAAAAAAITPRTAALIPVHIYGHPAAMPELVALAEKHGLLLVEDAAQAHAAKLDGRAAGAWGDVAMFSFYPTKNMTTGEGGMVVVRDPAVGRQVRLLRNQGMEERYRNEIVGFNQRMTDMNAAIGLVQLRHLAERTRMRQANAARYDAELTGVVVPPVAAGAEHVYHQYTLRSPERDGLMAQLEKQGVQSGVYYPTPVHRLEPFKDMGADLPETDRATEEALSIPIGPHLDAADVDRVVAAVNG